MPQEIDRAQATVMGELFSSVPGVQSVGSGRVEVLRGPASSTLYGAGALGGVINFETEDFPDFLEDSNTAGRPRTSHCRNSDKAAGPLIFANRPAGNLENLVALSHGKAADYQDGNGKEIFGSEFDAISGLLKSRPTFAEQDEQALTVFNTRWNSDLDDTNHAQTGSSGFGTVDREITDDTLTTRYPNASNTNPILDLDVVLSYSNTQVDQSDATYAPTVCSRPSLFCDSEYGYQTTSSKMENTARFTTVACESFIATGLQFCARERTAETDAGGLGYPDFRLLGGNR